MDFKTFFWSWNNLDKLRRFSWHRVSGCSIRISISQASSLTGLSAEDIAKCKWLSCTLLKSYNLLIRSLVFSNPLNWTLLIADLFFEIPDASEDNSWSVDSTHGILTRQSPSLGSRPSVTQTLPHTLTSIALQHSHWNSPYLCVLYDSEKSSFYHKSTNLILTYNGKSVFVPGASMRATIVTRSAE